MATTTSNKKKFFNEPTGKYRSKLEAYAASMLKANKIEFAYEPVSVEVLPAFAFPRCVERWGKTYKVVDKVKSINYTPDFVGPNWVIETKGFKTEEFKLRWKLFKKFILENGYQHYYLFMPHSKSEVNSTIKELKTNIIGRIDRRRKSLLDYAK